MWWSDAFKALRAEEQYTPVPRAVVDGLTDLLRERDPTIDVRSFLMGLSVGWQCGRGTPAGEAWKRAQGGGR